MTRKRAAAVMLMTIPITVAAALVTLFNLPERSRATPHFLSSRLPAWIVVSVASLALAVQFLGLIFTLSRGPWIGTLFAIALMFSLSAIFLGRGGTGRLALIISLATVITVAVLLNPSLKTGIDPGEVEASGAVAVSEDPTLSAGAVTSPVRETNAGAVIEPASPARAIALFGTTPNAGPEPYGTTRSITVSVDPNALEALQRFSSIAGVVTGGLTGGRQTHWKVSWILIRDRPWFEFDSLSLRWLRPLVGYGPDLFRYIYLLKSPPKG